MHIITRRRLLEFGRIHPTSTTALDHWYRTVKHTDFASFADIRSTFPSADQVGGLIVFNIGGNKARLLAYIDYRKKRVYIRDVLTHRKYDEGKWKD